jgi:hypothetical protein
MTGKVRNQRVIPFRNNRGLLYLSVILALLASLSIANVSSGMADKSTLMKILTENEDHLITTNDLAFLLVTHDFDAMPKGDHVEVRLNNTIYKLVPNGGYLGLANVTFGS